MEQDEERIKRERKRKSKRHMTTDCEALVERDINFIFYDIFPFFYH